MTSNSAETIADNRPVVELSDVLAARVAMGLPVYVSGVPSVEFLDTITLAAKQAGAGANIVQLFDVQPPKGCHDSLNSVANFLDEPDACMGSLMQGAGVRYMSLALHAKAKQVGADALVGSPATIRALVDAWTEDSSLADFADAVRKAFLPG